MTTDPANALVRAMIAMLLTSSGLTNIIGQQIFDEPPADALPPYLLITRGEAKPYGGTPPSGKAEAEEHILTLTAVSQFGGAEEARNMMSWVRAGLHDAQLTLDGWQLINLRLVFCDVYRGADGHCIFGPMRFRAVIEPA